MNGFSSRYALPIHRDYMRLIPVDHLDSQVQYTTNMAAKETLALIYTNAESNSDGMYFRLILSV